MNDICKHPGCEMPRGKAFGWCNAHYIRAARGKDMAPPVRKHNATDEESYWPKVERGASCWTWTGALTNGYGIFRINGGTQVAHRVSFRWANGEIPDGAEVDHMCFNRACVNPKHLRLLDHQENGQNRASANSNSKSGVRGVYWLAERDGWMAAAYIREDIHRMGPFSTIEEAETAIVAWRQKNMPASINDQKRKA